MRWKKLPQSDQVERRRGGRRRGRGGVALGGLGTLLVAGLILLLGGDVGDVFQFLGQNNQPSASVRASPSPEQQRLEEFASRSLGGTELVWGKIFSEAGLDYRKPKMVIYSGATRLDSGQMVDARMGPFYVPAEERIYLDVNFFEELEQRFGAAGDAAWAYVIAHEVAHHVQNLSGRSAAIHQLRQRDPANSNRYSVRLELHADYLAGVWAHHVNRMRTREGEPIYEPGDLDEAIRAAKAIGDDNLQQMSQGQVIPSNFTHGTSAQRMRWFRRGFESGDPGGGDSAFEVDYGQL